MSEGDEAEEKSQHEEIDDIQQELDALIVREVVMQQVATLSFTIGFFSE
jgi:hypothetical protein